MDALQAETVKNLRIAKATIAAQKRVPGNLLNLPMGNTLVQSDSEKVSSDEENSVNVPSIEIKTLSDEKTPAESTTITKDDTDSCQSTDAQDIMQSGDQRKTLKPNKTQATVKEAMIMKKEMESKKKKNDAKIEDLSHLESESDSGLMNQDTWEGGEKRKAPKKKKNRGVNRDFKLTMILKEHHKTSLWGVAINVWKTRKGETLFATVGSNKVTIYESYNNEEVKLLKCFEDLDPAEEFCTCAWGFDREKKTPILAAAGETGNIRIICPYKLQIISTIEGHLSQRINELKFSIRVPELLLSASQDCTLKLFNVKTETVVAIFGGSEGHVDEVLCCDFNMSEDKMVSGSMDHSLKIWSTGTEAIKKKIQESQTYDSKTTKEAFSTVQMHFPLMTTRDIHNNYVDCCRFYGNFILSKTVDDYISMWKPADDLDKETALTPKPYTKVYVHDCQLTFTNQKNVWFEKFGTDLGVRTVAVGNHRGKVYVWNINVEWDGPIKPITLTHPLCTAQIRQTAFSKDGSLLICVGEDGSIWHWKKMVNRESLENVTSATA